MSNEEIETLDDVSIEESSSIVGEFLSFLGENKKFWLIPVLLVISIIGILAVAAGSSLSPFIYALF